MGPYIFSFVFLIIYILPRLLDYLINKDIGNDMKKHASSELKTTYKRDRPTISKSFIKNNKS